MIGFWPANAAGDDIEVYADEARSKVVATAHTLRQQMARRDLERANLALADFIAPKDSGVADYLGGFAVTAGPEVEARAERFKRDQDDYSAILLLALGDRLAEAFAERMHERVRQEFWGFAADEKLSNRDLIGEQYRGIRPAPGYPACPDHTEKWGLFDLLEPEATVGIALTESCAMTPAASVSGLLLLPSREPLFRHRAHRSRSGRGLCRAQGPQHSGGGALARAQPGLRSDGRRGVGESAGRDSLV